MYTILVWVLTPVINLIKDWLKLVYKIFIIFKNSKILKYWEDIYHWIYC